MKIVLITSAVILVPVFVLFFLPMRLMLVYERKSKKNKAVLTLKYLFFNFKLFDSAIKKNHVRTKDEAEEVRYEKEKGKIENYIKIFTSVKADIIKVLDFLAKRSAVVEKIDVFIDFGFSDAMYTGIFTGLLNGFVYSILGVIHQHMQLKSMNVNIQPEFENQCFEVNTECIIRLKIVHIIIATLNILKILRKIRKMRKIERSS